MQDPLFENVVKVKRNSLVLEEGVKEKLCSDQGDFKVGVLNADNSTMRMILYGTQAVSTEAFSKR